MQLSRLVLAFNVPFSRSSQVNQHHISQLEGHSVERSHVPPTKVFPRLAVNKTILKPRLAAATGAKYIYVGFSWPTLQRLYDIRESNPVPASGL